MMKALIFFLFFLTTVSAREINYLARSPKALLMGDAYTALADDAFTLFYNPAALGRHTGIDIHLINPVVGVTNALDDLDRFKNFPDGDAVAISDRIMGYPVHSRVGFFPGMKFGSFAFSAIYNNQANLALRNKTHPFLDTDYRYDRGFIVGYAYTFQSGRSGTRHKGKYRQVGNRTSIGVSAKYINREGIDRTFDLFGTRLLNRIEQGVADIDDLKREMGYSEGKGVGFDLGVEHSIGGPNSSLTIALSVLDIGDTTFDKKSGVYDVPTQKMRVNAGFAFKQDFKVVDYALAIDLHPLNEDIDFMRKLHAGLELNFPLISVYGGFNGGYWSYGAGVNFWPFKLTAGFYGTEIGVKYKQEQSKRAVLMLSLFDFSFGG
jgi:hypothetical protein